jgi:hypothetical protein
MDHAMNVGHHGEKLVINSPSDCMTQYVLKELTTRTQIFKRKMKLLDSSNRYK